MTWLCKKSMKEFLRKTIIHPSIKDIFKITINTISCTKNSDVAVIRFKLDPFPFLEPCPKGAKRSGS